MKELSDVLRSQGVGMDDPLVDQDGFPRADIDVYQVCPSLIRKRFIEAEYL